MINILFTNAKVRTIPHSYNPTFVVFYTFLGINLCKTKKVSIFMLSIHKRDAYNKIYS